MGRSEKAHARVRIADICGELADSEITSVKTRRATGTGILKDVVDDRHVRGPRVEVCEVGNISKIHCIGEARSREGCF
jgi:hypothetical protein